MSNNQLAALSEIVLEAIMTDCLLRMETSIDELYINKQITLFRKAENELHRRRKCFVISKEGEIFGQ